MGGWMEILWIVLAGLFGWMMYRLVKGRPDLFARAALSQSVTTLGALALLLIGFVALCVFLLKHAS